MKQISHEFKCNLPSSFFTKTEAGEYCSSCKTVVIDFTEKSNEEILQILSANGGVACGSAYEDQFEERASSRFRTRVAIAGLAAMLGLGTGAAKARATDAVKTEIVSGTSCTHNFETTVSNTGTQTPAIDSPDKPDKKPTEVKRKTFLRLGRRSFYTMNVFPFIGTRKIRKGMYAYKR